MGNTYISSNIKKESVRIDPQGNIINPRTKEIVKEIEKEFVAPQEVPQAPAPTIENKVSSKIDEMISKKIEELVAKKVEEALNKL